VISKTFLLTKEIGIIPLHLAARSYFPFSAGFSKSPSPDGLNPIGVFFCFPPSLKLLLLFFPFLLLMKNFAALFRLLEPFPRYSLASVLFSGHQLIFAGSSSSPFKTPSGSVLDTFAPSLHQVPIFPSPPLRVVTFSPPPPS